MRKILLALAVIVVLLLRTPRGALAHFPATDGSITAVLHVEPEDNPVTERPAMIDFIFEDGANKFQLAKCDCRLSISKQHQELYYAYLAATQFDEPTVYGGGVPYTFPDTGEYHIALAGKPAIPGAFQPFNLSWNLAVSRQAVNSQGSSFRTFLNFFAAATAIFLFVGILLFLLA